MAFSLRGFYATPAWKALRRQALSRDNYRFWISVRGPLARQAVALQRISELMADMPEVDLGTTTAPG